MLSSVNVNLAIAVDANIHVDTDGQWQVRKEKDVHVCVPSIVAGVLPGWAIKMVTKLNPFGGTIDLKQMLQNTVYCAFKYTLPDKDVLLPLLEFVASKDGSSDAVDPLLEFSTRKKLTKTDEENDASDALLTDTDINIQFEMPTMPFVQFVVMQGHEAAVERVQAMEQRTSEDKPSSLRPPTADALNSASELNVASMDKAALELTAYFDTMAVLLTNKNNNMMAAAVKTIRCVFLYIFLQVYYIVCT